MSERRGSIISIGVSLIAVLLYPLFLIVSAMFVVPLTLIHQSIAGRAAEVSSSRERAALRARRFIFIDVTATIVTYLVSDIVRCRFWLNQEWPEVVPGYGSTRFVHLAMMLALVAAWPTILYWLGWYRPRWRSAMWRIRNTGTAAILLALVMSSIALLSFREIYPRMQIGLTILLLPLITGLIRGITEWLQRGRHRGVHPSRLDPVW